MKLTATLDKVSVIITDPNGNKLDVLIDKAAFELEMTEEEARALGFADQQTPTN
jgi:predicted aspartyl protease